MRMPPAATSCSATSATSCDQRRLQAAAARCRSSASLPARALFRRAMLDEGVRGGEEDALMAVLPLNQVRRAPLVAVDLEDLAMTVFIALMAALNRQLVAYCC